ncbi:dihydrodipicolinate synthase family protein [Neorhizobium lilium]|uniref:Dihydrodipicolinate synthase family protein n=1 Tax=Neorhizobium lilium TaxID=2503024 RepID=A0A3S4UKV2_9HYPH|nr:dihydrodipicolinate synthase family protein [Neorhizobium lilium]RWX76023.1 dihydrodipicolinate synthase family protein [Neorhizobium lilium]
MPQPIFAGLSAFPLTPADEAGRVETEGLQRLLKRILDADVQSIGLLGSTGTYMYLSREERRRAIAAAVECVNRKVPIIVGIGALRTDEAQALAQDAAKEGADALLLAPVSYTPLTEEEAFRHFEAVAGATDLPLCIYNNPSTTHFNFSEPLLERLAGLPTIQGVKMPLPKDADFAGEIARLRAVTPVGFMIGYSGDWGAAESLLAGGDAWYSVVAGLFPSQAAALTRAATQGQATEVDYLDKAFAPFWRLFKAHGSLRVVYAAANILGLTDAKPPRPILPLSPDLTPAIEAAIAALEG